VMLLTIAEYFNEMAGVIRPRPKSVGSKNRVPQEQRSFCVAHAREKPPGTIFRVFSSCHWYGSNKEE
jgi:hypothetical protein